MVFWLMAKSPAFIFLQRGLWCSPGSSDLVVYLRFLHEVLEFESNNLKTMDLSTKGAA